MRFGTDGRRHQNIGEREERATDTAISTDRALHRALLAHGLVVMAAGGMVSLNAARTRLVMGRMIVVPMRRAANVRRHWLHDHRAASGFVPGPAHHHRDRDRTFGRDSQQ